MASFVDFEAVKQTVNIDEAARSLGLTLIKSGVQFRSPCPTCNTGGPRALVVTPNKALFYCFASQEGGDVIALAQHILNCEPKQAAMHLAELVGISTRKSTGTSTSIAGSVPSERTAPPALEKAPEKAGKPAQFDPQAFAQKLEYTIEVRALGFTQEDAERFSIGSYRGRIYVPVRHPNGDISGFVGITGGEWKVPSKWLEPQEAKVIRFEKRA